jgi:hypothetical protein
MTRRRYATDIFETVMDDGGRDMQRSIRHHLVVAPRVVVLMALVITGLAAMSALHAPRAQAAGIDPIIHWDSSMIYAGQNNGYPWGPVGELAMVHGEKFTATGVLGMPIKLALLKGDVNNPPGGGSSYEFCRLAVPKIPIGQVTVSGSGAFDFNFTWPGTAGSGMYSICAYNTLDGLPVGNIDDGPFTVLSSSPPSVAVSRTSVGVGETITVTGKNWTPPQDVSVYIAACVDCDGPIVVAGTAHSSGLNSGTFSMTFTIPDAATPGAYVAGAHAHGGVLDVGPTGGKHVTITAAVPTPTVEPSPTAQSTVAAGGGAGADNTDTGSGVGGVSPLVFILAGVGLLLLIALLILFATFLSRRGANRTPPGAIGGSAPGWGGSGPSAGGYPEYGDYPPPGSGSVQQNWSTLPPGWGDQTPPTISHGMPQGDDSPTRPGSYDDTPPTPYNPYGN